MLDLPQRGGGAVFDLLRVLGAALFVRELLKHDGARGALNVSSAGYITRSYRDRSGNRTLRMPTNVAQTAQRIARRVRRTFSA